MNFLIVVFTESPQNGVVMVDILDDGPEELSRNSGTLQLKHGSPREPIGGSDSSETGNLIQVTREKLISGAWSTDNSSGE